MPSILAKSPNPSQAKAGEKNSIGKRMGVVKIRALFSPHIWASIQEESKFSGIDFQNLKLCPTQFWRYGLKYQLLVKFDIQDVHNSEFIRTVKVRTTRPQIGFQPIGRWREHNSNEPLDRDISTRRNQQLNVLLVDAQRLITNQSSISLHDPLLLPDTQSKVLEAAWPKYSFSSRQLVEISTPVDIEHLCRAPKVLERFRRGKYTEMEALLSLPIPPLKLLESILQTGRPELFAKLVSSGRMPSLNWSNPPNLKGQFHLLGALPVEAKLMFFLAAKQNLVGLEQQVQQGIPWNNLLSEATHHHPHSSAINFLGYHLPCPRISFKPDPDPIIRKNLARCAYQYSAGFNLLSPTAITLLQAGAGLEESLELCQTSQGTGLKKYVLQNFDSVSHLLSPQSETKWRSALIKEPWLTKLTKLAQPKNKICEIESIELF